VTVLGAHPARLDEVVHAGDPVDTLVAVLESDGDPQSLAGWTVAAQALSPLNEAVLHTFTTAIVGTSIRVTATPTETRAWTWPHYAVRLEVTATPPSGAASPIASGWLRFYPH
jgi:methenyltetrahydromethanopterin cyclohydrolase